MASVGIWNSAKFAGSRSLVTSTPLARTETIRTRPGGMKSGNTLIDFWYSMLLMLKYRQKLLSLPPAET